MLVSFEQIYKVMPGQANVIGPVPDGIDYQMPLGNIINPSGSRVTLYDPLWGYFTFSQQVDFVYDDAGSYSDVAGFTIEGTWTLDAEIAASGVNIGGTAPFPSDYAAFMLLVNKLDTLTAVFASGANAPEPALSSDWGTANDPRCVVLPEPLRDRFAARVYGFPVSIEVEETRFPQEIKYRALLREAKRPSMQIEIGGILASSAVIEIVPPQPILNRHRLVGGAGEVYQVVNYSRTSLSIRFGIGSQPKLNHILSQKSIDLATLLGNGVVDITAQRHMPDGSIQADTVFPIVQVIKPQYEYDMVNRKINVTFQGIT